MGDIISRQAAISELRKCQTYLLYEGDDEPKIERSGAEAVIMHLPSAQPEIIRCKDCKYWMPYDWMFSEVWRSQNIDDYAEDEKGCRYCDMNMGANDFCSRAKRKEECMP